VAGPDAQIKFDAPAVLRKWPSLNKGRISNATPYFIVEGTLDECLREFTSKPTSQHHLYEIHTAPQGELITAVLSALPGLRGCFSSRFRLAISDLALVR
jgi:hypothetical protein